MQRKTSEKRTQTDDGIPGYISLGRLQAGLAYGRRWRGHGNRDETFKAVVVCSIRNGNGLRLYVSSLGDRLIEGFRVEGSTRGRGYIITRGWDVGRRDHCFHM